MVKKVHVEIDIKGSASGFGGRKDNSFAKDSSKDIEERRKVFSGEDFKL